MVRRFCIIVEQVLCEIDMGANASLRFTHLYFVTFWQTVDGFDLLSGNVSCRFGIGAKIAFRNSVVCEVDVVES